ncbi:hypothetical protein JVT61DRAFT_3040 [Boletus reticuloceps]|uniref:Uncharacterized protein n=1 Tax=Boletus reticuloceps TaxID=495285 RepID=A0A8I3A8A0_9AGAM|nr:hypothetical protein JVT61DRAFT_3040 [Boletus reticuloceps]
MFATDFHFLVSVSRRATALSTLFTTNAAVRSTVNAEKHQATAASSGSFRVSEHPSSTGRSIPRRGRSAEDRPDNEAPLTL